MWIDKIREHSIKTWQFIGDDTGKNSKNSKKIVIMVDSTNLRSLQTVLF